MAKTKVDLGSSVKEILEKINEEDIYILEISSDGGSLTETQFTQFKENFPYVSILLWYAGYQYLITNIQEHSYTDEGGVRKSYVGDITVNDAELRVTINENGIWTAQPFIPASKQISDISVGKRTLQKISLGRKNDNEGVSIVTEETDEAGSISYEVNEDNSQSLILTAAHVIEFKGNVNFSNATVTGLPSGETPDNVAIYEGSANDSEIILSNTSVDNGIKTSGIKIVPSGKDGQNVSNITYSDQEVPTSKNVRWALNEFGQNFAAADFSSSKFKQNEVIIGGEHLANLYAVKGSGAYFTNSSSFTANGKPIDDTHIPTTSVVKTIVDDAILSSGGSSGGTLSIEVNELPTENIDDSKIYVLSAIENVEVYYHDEVSYYTLRNLITSQLSVSPEITYYVVKELPTSPLTSDLATFSSIHCYIYNDIAYVYGNLGAGNMWLTVSALASQIAGITIIDKGRTPNIATENNDIAMYVYYEDYKKFYLYSNEQWVQITDSKSNTYILSLSGTSGTLTDEQYQAIKDNFPNVIVLYNGDDGSTLVLPIVGTVSGAYFAMYTTNITSTSIIIAPSKEWMYTEESYSHNYVTVNGVHQDINGSKTFNGDVTFDCPVDFTNANVTGLPTTEVDTSTLVTLDTEQTISGKKTFSGIKIGNANIEYDSENNLNISNSAENINIYANSSIYFTVDAGDIVFESGLYVNSGATFEGINSVTFNSNTQFNGNINIGSTGLLSNEGGYTILKDDVNLYLCAGVENNYIDIYDDYIEYFGNHQFNGLTTFNGTVDFTNATEVKGLPSGGSLDLNADYNWNGNHTFNNGLTLNGALTLANNGEISDSEEQLQIYKGTGSMWIGTEEGGVIEITNGGMTIESYNGLNLLGTQIALYANGNESSSGINLYDTSIEYNAQVHQFFGEVDFSDATVTGLPSSGGSSDLTELKRVMRLLHTEKYTQRIQATKFTSTPMGSIHKIEKPSNDLLEASEYVLYSVDFEDAPAYLNATITIGNNGLINDSGTFSFTLQGSSIAAGQNINVICVFVPSAFL